MTATANLICAHTCGICRVPHMSRAGDAWPTGAMRLALASRVGVVCVVARFSGNQVFEQEECCSTCSSHVCTSFAVRLLSLSFCLVFLTVFSHCAACRRSWPPLVMQGSLVPLDVALFFAYAVCFSQLFVMDVIEHK